MTKLSPAQEALLLKIADGEILIMRTGLGGWWRLSRSGRVDSNTAFAIRSRGLLKLDMDLDMEHLEDLGQPRLYYGLSAKGQEIADQIRARR